MPNVTKQTNISRGSDGSNATRNQTVGAKSNRTTQGGGVTAKQTELPVTTTETAKAAIRTTQERSEAQTTSTQEDHSFTISFSVPLKGAVPCTPPPNI